MSEAPALLRKEACREVMSERLVLVQLSSATASGMAPMSAAFVEKQDWEAGRLPFVL